MMASREVIARRPARAAAFNALLCLGLLTAAQPAAAEGPSAAGWIEDVSQRAGTILLASSSSESERGSQIERLLVDSIDLPALGDFALGRHARVASHEQLQRFDLAFRSFALRNFARLVTGFDSTTLRIGETKRIDAQAHLVTSYLDQEGQEPLEVVWRVRTRDGRHRIVDVLVEGISMALTLREEFSSVSRVRGIEGLIERLWQGPLDREHDGGYGGATRLLLQSAMGPGTFRGLSN